MQPYREESGSATKAGVARIVAVFALFTAIHLGLTGAILAPVVRELQLTIVIEAVNELAFVVLTALLLWILVRRLVRQIEQAHRAEREMLLTHNRAAAVLQAVADASPDGIFAKDLEGRFLLFSRGSAQIAGVEEARVLGRDNSAPFPPEQAAILDAQDEHVIAQGRIQTFEEEIVTPAGPRSFLTTKGPLRDADGRLIGMFGIARDITERKRDELALLDREREFRVLVEQMPAISYRATLDERRTTRFISPRLAELGYKPEEWLADPDAWGSAVHPDDLERVLAKIRSGLTSGGEISVDYRLRSAAGRWCHMHDTAVRVSPGNGRPEELHGVMLDVTDRAEMEAALRESDRQARLSELRYRLLFDSSPLPMLVYDLVTLRFLTANAAAVAHYGWSVEDFQAMTILDLRPPEERERLVRAPPSLATGTAMLGTWTHWRKDGSLIEVEVSRAEIELDGKVACVATINDVTERRAQELRLRLLSQAVEQSSESIVITNLVPEIEYANASALAHSGYTSEELVGCDPRVLQSGRTPKETYDELWATLGEGRSWKGILFNRRKDGSEYTEFAVISPVRAADGSVVNYLSVQEDVTEKARLGEELDQHRHHLESLVERRTAELALATQAAEAANEAKSAFLAVMSHEIRTPMNGIVGIVDVLRQSSLSPYQIDLADTIRESAFALLVIIDDILDFSKIEAHRMALEAEPVELTRLIEGTCDALLLVSVARRVRLRVFVDPRLPAWITSDAVRLRQILTNLIGNAIKFSARPERFGQVRLRAEPDDGGRLRLQVIDDGIGMTPETQARIFRPFEQAEGSTTRRYGGTGLGLAICSAVVDLFGGTIAVQSEPGVGSIFTVVLPLKEDAGQSGSTLPHDLGGLVCHVALGDAQQARDWCDYLEAAGARAQAWPDFAALEQAMGASTGERPVAIVETDNDAALAALATTLAGGALVCVTPGQRRRARVAGPARVNLDGEAVHRDALLEAVALATGRSTTESNALALGLPIGAVEPPDVEDAAAQHRLILVAEDNDINRRVIRHQLALLGLACETADDGLQALARWRDALASRRYGLLLTDLHMPAMDGYELTAAIRAGEPAAERLPIVALTANALSGEAERCRAAGMDDYLSKPVQMAQLGTILARWLPSAPTAVPSPAAAPDARGLPALDPTALAKLIGDDSELLAEFRRDYLASARASADEVRTASAHGEWAQAGAVAHKLKSSSRAVGAFALGDCCERLELAAKVGDGEAVRALQPGFEAALEAVIAGLGGEAGSSATATLAAATGVLLVDDELFHLEMLQRQLSMLGVTPVQALRSGESALEWLNGRDTSALLLLLDLNMPGMDGVEFMRHLAERRFAGALALISGADVRVLDTASKLARAYRLSVLAHLHKPVDSDTLRELMQRWNGFAPALAGRRGNAYEAQELMRAIDGGELLLHYQPKVTLADGALEGVEALVRWQHPVDGLVYPDRFIGTAESSGLIDALTRGVLTMALAQLRRWHDSAFALRMAVNISMSNLARVDFAEFVFDELARHGVPPTALTLEVTESQLASDVCAQMNILTRMRLRQVGLSIDDFGTGHSSLAQLRDMPFDELKVDRGFVHGSGSHPTQSAIFGASLALAHQIGMKVVAEGVEDRADWNFVRATGCDIAQGYFVARPMPADELLDWAARWQRRFETL